MSLSNSVYASQQIQTWTENETPDKARDIIVENNNVPSVLVTSFVPYTKNFVRVLVFNGAYDGPESEEISFVTPEGSKYWFLAHLFSYLLLELSGRDNVWK